jgi:hypothetical protein
MACSSVDVFTADTRLQPPFPFRLLWFRFLELVLIVDMLRREGLWFLLLQQLFGLDVGPALIRVFAVRHRQAELLRAMMPVEDVRLARRIVPFDQRFTPASGREREWRRGGRFLGHVHTNCKLVACEAEANWA